MKNICCEFWQAGGGFVRPRWGRGLFLTLAVGFTHGYPCGCPADSEAENLSLRLGVSAVNLEP